MKKRLIVLLLASPIIFAMNACGSKSDAENNKGNIVEQIQIGGTYSLGASHKIQFKTSSSYWIYQSPLNCGGEGNWSQTKNIINLGPNNSDCESTRNIPRKYSFKDNELHEEK